MTVYISDEDIKKARENGINEITLNARVRILGWSIEKAITKPVQSSASGIGSEHVYYVRVKSR